MASNENIGENSNTSGSDNYSETNDEVQVNPMVLLVRIKHVDGRPIEPEILKETTFCELCQFANPNHEPFAVKILSPHEVCITYRQGVSLGQVAGELMAIESWRDFPILITIIIIKRSKVDSIVEVRQKYRQERKDQELRDLKKFKQGQCDLQVEFEFKQKLIEQDIKQGSLLKAVEQLTEKVTKLEVQPLHTQGFMTSSSQNVSNFGNLLTSFQFKADIDIGKFSGIEPTPTDKLNFGQWCIDVKSYQASYPDNILLPAIRKSIVGRANLLFDT